MRKRTYMDDRRDHSFRIPRPDLSQKAGTRIVGRPGQSHGSARLTLMQQPLGYLELAMGNLDAARARY
jgi:hypothetical protein